MRLPHRIYATVINHLLQRVSARNGLRMDGMHAGHDCNNDRVVDAIAKEALRVSLPASSNNALLRSVYSHQQNGKRADCVVTGGDSLPASVKDDVDHIGVPHLKHWARLRCPRLESRVPESL